MKGEMCTMRKVIGVLAAFVALAALSVPLPAADGPVTIVLPNAASIVGAAPFFSDVRVFNTSYSDGVDVMATYRCLLGTCPATAPPFLISLSPRQSMALDDNCVSAFGAPNSAGGVEFDYREGDRQPAARPGWPLGKAAGPSPRPTGYEGLPPHPCGARRAGGLPCAAPRPGGRG
jgi:hypothetical protein